MPEIIRSTSPGQMVVKIVNDHLTEMLGSESVEINLASIPPVAIMMVGLQGSGKTTTTAKVADYLRKRFRKKTIMASLDVRRPAAQKQLEVLGKESEIDTLQIIPFETPEQIAKRAMDTGRKEGYDAVILDTAGRQHIDQTLTEEAARIHSTVKPAETLFVADAMTGQDAVIAVKAFHQELNLTGIVLTRIDGDARGGAALSVRSVTGCPIKFLGTGEKIDALEVFHPERIASRILGMGDVVTLVEKAAETADEDDAEKLEAKIQKGQFDFDDFAKQIKQVRKMGGMGGIMGMLPGAQKIKSQMAGSNIDEKGLARQEAIIFSMTKTERNNPKIFNGSRRKRVAEGAGTTVQEVNRLLKQFQQMTKMMKRMNKLGKKGMMRQNLPGMIGR